MQLKQVNEALDHLITESCAFQWKCYGMYARFMDYESEFGNASVVVNTKTQEICEATVDEKDGEYPYRWIAPKYRKRHVSECRIRNIDPNVAWDDVAWIDLETEEDWLEKATAIIAGDSFDPDVKIPINLPDDQMLVLAMDAHNKNVTLNTHINDILRRYISEEEASQ